EAGRHRGGSTPFTIELTGLVAPGATATVVVRARDDARAVQPRGKQSDALEPYGCLYPRTTGIWQTVWLEHVPASFLCRPRLTPDVASSTIRLEQRVDGPRRGLHVRAMLCDAKGEVCTAATAADTDAVCTLDLRIPDQRCRLWSIDDP